MATDFTFNKFKNKIDLINSEIKNIVSGEPKKLYEAANHLFRKEAGGKRVRPILCLLSCEAVGGKQEDAVLTAAATELIHTFTLIHDDIMDDDELRRGLLSVHAAYGKTTAIIAGDLLFAKAFEICDKRATKILSIASSDVCEGQELDMAFEERDFISEDDYMTMIRKKTAALIEASTRTGAIVGNASEEEVDMIAKYGRNIGLAFQIHDDILDLTGDEEKIGKPAGSDIYEGKKTLIVIKAFEFLNESTRCELLEILNKKENSQAEVNRAIELINNCGAMDYCKNKERELVEDAKNLLKIFPDSEAKQDLIDIADFVIQRDR